jgi:hypothetical protein
MSRHVKALVAVALVLACDPLEREAKREASAGQSKPAAQPRMTAQSAPAKTLEPTQSIPEPQKPALVKVPAIEAKLLYDLYRENELRAYEEFRGKPIMVLGVLQRVGRDALDRPYVGFGPALGGVQCMLAPESVATAARLERGAEIGATAIVDGLMGNVVLSGCVLRDGIDVARLKRMKRGESYVNEKNRIIRY